MIQPASRRVRYPSDLTEPQWERVAPLLPAERVTGRPRLHALRDVLDAISYRWETGCAWRMLPHDFPPWGTVYTCFRQWQRSGVLRQVREALLRRRLRPVRRGQQRNSRAVVAEPRLQPFKPPSDTGC